MVATEHLGGMDNPSLIPPWKYRNKLKAIARNPHNYSIHARYVTPKIVKQLGYNLLQDQTIEN
jgi:uncharacterized radical SAM superfamily protein